jgi:tricorn protease
MRPGRPTARRSRRGQFPTLYWLDLESGKATKVASEPVYGPTGLRSLRVVVAGFAVDRVHARQLFRLPRRPFTPRGRQIASGHRRPSDARDPVFDAGGKYLYVLASTDAGPVNQWFAQSNADMRVQRALPGGPPKECRRHCARER